VRTPWPHLVPPERDVRIVLLRDRLRTGFWFIPLVAGVAGWAASGLVHRIDVELGGDQPAWLATDGTPAQASQVLSTIAGSILTFTGIVFSITAVALQLASSQFSPRALRNFLRDRNTQWTLGLLVATFTYALLTLRHIDPDADPATTVAPGLSVTLALALALGSLVAFVFFVDHLAHSIRVVSIIERVAGETRTAVRESIPLADPGPPPQVPDRPPDMVIAWERGPGVIVGYDADDLVAIARSSDVLLRLVHHVGDYVPSRAPALEVWRVDTGDGDGDGDGGPDGQPLDEAAVLRFIGAGIERTMTQDAMFGFRQLVDIAEKALSPAVNDPTTAVQALHRLHDLLRRIVTRPQPTGVSTDAAGTPRLIVPVAQWDDYLRLACSEIRQYGAASLQVARRMRAMLDDLMTVAPPERRPALHRELGLLDRAIDAAFDEPDLRALARGDDYQGVGA
jgi:uncharacterized membrane protein